LLVVSQKPFIYLVLELGQGRQLGLDLRRIFSSRFHEIQLHVPCPQLGMKRQQFLLERQSQLLDLEQLLLSQVDGTDLGITCLALSEAERRQQKQQAQRKNKNGFEFMHVETPSTNLYLHKCIHPWAFTAQ
jgi:hypothetical protein